MKRFSIGKAPKRWVIRPISDEVRGVMNQHHRCGHGCQTGILARELKRVEDDFALHTACLNMLTYAYERERERPLLTRLFIAARAWLWRTT